MHHELKLNETFWEAVQSGEKNFEIRCVEDRCFNKGDTVIFLRFDEIFQAWDEEGKTFEITFVLSGWGLKENYVAFGIKEK